MIGLRCDECDLGAEEVASSLTGDPLSGKALFLRELGAYLHERRSLTLGRVAGQLRQTIAEKPFQALAQRHAQPVLAAWLAGSSASQDRRRAAKSPYASDSVLDHLARDPELSVRRELTLRDRLPEPVRLRLLEDAEIGPEYRRHLL